MLKEGQKAPEFKSKDAKGNEVSLDQFKGKRVVLYFYPKDNTPGCNIEACSFRDNYDEILETGAVIIGVSPDNKDSHQKFINKFSLQFILLSDEDHKVAEVFGAWGEKSMFGKKYMGIIRSTFVIDGEGIIEKVFPKVTPTNHGDEILRYLKGM